MKKVRKGVFETNSSSMHSIVISEEDDEKYEDYKSRNLSFRDVFETEEDKIVITLRRYDKSVMLKMPKP